MIRLTARFPRPARALAAGAVVLALLGGSLALAESVPAPRLPGLTASALASVDGHPVYYEVGGPVDGSPVLLVHGIGAGASSWLFHANTAALAERARVYALDLPGFARSGAEPIRYTNDLYTGVVRDFIKTVIGKPADVIGLSLGADYAIRVAAENPELVRRLVVIDPTGYHKNPAGTTNEDWYRRLSGTVLGPIAFDLVRSPGSLGFFLMNTVYLNPSLATPEVQQIYSDNLNSPNKGYAPWAFFTGLLDQPAAETWPKVSAPSLIVWATDDPFTPLASAQDFLKVRDVPLVVLPGRAAPNEESWPKFNARVLDFLGLAGGQ
ncbi:MAG TPA: alpha/beta fold hydrolase [Deinococcales bacterium]|nr:alpha/beta fold hydrolase [Deinococcales bacterium]